MWPFTKKHRIASDKELLTLIDQLDSRLATLEERHAQLKSQHLKLRGTVYGNGMHKRDDDDDAEEAAPTKKKPKEMTRDEVKRMLVATGRFVPGRPAIHNE